MSPMPITSVTTAPRADWMWSRISGMPPPGSPPVTTWATWGGSLWLARYCANDGVTSSVSTSPARSAKRTRSVSPGPTGTTREPIRSSTKCVWPATKGPAPKVLSTECSSWIPVA